MSVQTEIDRIITAVHAAHEKVKEKGGTTSEPYLVANLEDAIGSIPSDGAAAETCTVVSNIAHAPIVVTKYENGSYIPAYTKMNSMYMHYGTIENVVCGSAIVVNYDPAYALTAVGAELMVTASNVLVVFKITAAPGETVTLNSKFVD